MNAFTAKDEMQLMMQGTFSHYFKDEDATMPQPEVARPGLLARVGSAVRWLVELPQRRAALDELGSLTDRELADIGLSRAELPLVFDPAFAERRNVERFASVNAGNRTVSATVR